MVYLAFMNTYDLTIVLDGKTTPAKKKSYIQRLEKLIDTLEGKLGKINDMGSRDLAYQIGKSTTGLYLSFELKLTGEHARNLNDKLRIDEGLLRYLLIRKLK